MINFIYSLMTDKRKGILFAPLKFILYILSLVYAAGLSVRKILYRTGVFKSNRVPMKIISVGNLTLGGTGKTPFVMSLVKIAKEVIGREAAILTRGYGWDEQALLKNKLADIPILARENRVDSAHKAIRLYGCDTAILDDGFQYWELERDLDIVLIDSKNPFGNGRLFPRGILREPREAISRADIVVFTKIDQAGVDTTSLKEELKCENSRLIFLEARHKPSALYDMKSKKEEDIISLKGKRVLLLSAIGDPKYFKESVKALGASVVAHLRFQDHHDYKKKDIDNIVRVCDERKFDFILTTEKDAVKFSRLGLSISNYKVMVLAVEMDIVKGMEDLIARLHSLYTR